MEKIDAINIPLQSEELETLKKYHTKALADGSQNFEWEKIDSDLRQEYPILKALDALGFVNFEMEQKSRGTVYDSYFLTLYPSAIHRAKYEKNNPVKKWIVRNRLFYKDWIAGIGFILSLVLTILKILEHLVN